MGTTASRMVKRLAADIMRVGVSRVRIDPSALERVESSITREDVKRLIKDGVVYKVLPSTPSRGRWRIRHEKRKRGRQRGPGSRKGPTADEKRQWMTRVRAQRRYLKTLKARGLIDTAAYRHARMLIKGGMFTSVRHLRAYLQEHGLLKVGGGGGDGQRRQV